MRNIIDKMPARFLLIVAAAVLSGCGGGVNILPEPFTRERADGKIPVNADLIRAQVQRELNGTPEELAEVERWQAIERDYNGCRLSSAESSKEKAEEVFAVCMSERDYVYMFPIDAEQFHNDIAFELEKERDARLAAEKKRREEVEIANKQKELNDALILAVQSGDKISELLLIIKGANPDIVVDERKRFEAKKKQEKEAARKVLQDILEHNLRMAARDGELSDLRSLLADGVNPNAMGEHGETALIFAALGGQAESTKILLAAGANPNAADNDGSTALMAATIKGHSEVVKILLAAGANVNAENKDDWTALMLAAGNGHAEIAKMLLSVGADVNAADNDGWTALIEAALDGHAEIVKLLLAAGANPNAADNDGLTALMWAVDKGYAKIVKILLAVGANVNAEDKDGWTALASAVKKLHLDIAEMLLAAGANPNHVFDSGISVMDNAIYDNYPEMLRLLRRYGGVCRKNC